MGSAAEAAELRRTALAFDDALAQLDRRLRNPNFDPAAELNELSKLEAQVEAMSSTCTVQESAASSASPDIRAQRTRIAIYSAELRRLQERIRTRAQRKEEAEKRSREGRVGGESDVAVAVARAHRHVDELLGQSVDTADELAAQRAHLEQALNDTLSVQALLSGLWALLGNVQRSRAKQTLMLALLFALCLCVFLYYSLRQSQSVSG